VNIIDTICWPIIAELILVRQSCNNVIASGSILADWNICTYANYSTVLDGMGGLPQVD
jgi:hypothetical protein